MAPSNSQPPNASASRVDNLPGETWLLPANRKLRNITSICIRNLSLTAPFPSRKRGQTIDDDALPHTLNSPAKLVALREDKTLGLSRSSTDLRALAERAIVEGSEFTMNGDCEASKHKKTPQNISPATAPRPDPKRLRRNSTLEWANASPQKRQEKLEQAIRERLADVFFTIHVHGIEGPVYVSETITKTMNPTFRQIDWTSCGPGITRLDQLTLRIWTKRDRSDWRQLLEVQLDLRALHYIGKSLVQLKRPLHPSSVLFEMVDGFYTYFPDALAEYIPHPHISITNTPTGSSPRSLSTASFDALLRLSKLDDSIQDALATRDQLANDLERLIQKNREALSQRDKVTEAADRAKTIDFAKKTVEKQLEKARKQQAEKRASITARREHMGSDLASRKQISQTMARVKREFPDQGEEHLLKKISIHSQQRRVCEDIQHCYAIDPLPGKTLSFTIRGLHLPNSDHLDTEHPEVVSAALGHVSHALELLAFYLRQALPYHVTPHGSTSTVYDPISILKTNAPVKGKAETTLRTYPLFTKGVPRFRFEYAVFLINQNIRVLLENAFNLRVLDVRQTLPNLKYLMVVATAGEGDLPARKAGGVRGLMRRPAMQRVASYDSNSSGMSGVTLLENGRINGAAGRSRPLGGKGKMAQD